MKQFGSYEKQEVNIRIGGQIDGDEEIVNETRGILQKINDKLHILYEDRLEEDAEVTKNHIVIDSSVVRIMKRGSVQMNLMFEEGLMFHTVYQVAEGMLPVDIETEKMTAVYEDSDIRLDIRYKIRFEGMEPMGNHLRIHISS